MNLLGPDGLVVYWAWYAAIGVVLSAVALSLFRNKRTADSHPQRRPSLAVMVMAVALVLRIAAVCVGPPRLSDDIWRYIHDGAALADGKNPYKTAPIDESPALRPHPPIHHLINNPDLISIYQPASQWVFAAAWRLRIEAFDALGDRTFRLCFVLIDLLLITVIMAKLRDAGRSPLWACLYAWHPLAISETAYAGHQDVIGIAPLLLAIWLVDRLRHSYDESTGAAGGDQVIRSLVTTCIAAASFAVAIAVKPIVAPLLLPMVWSLRRRPGLIVLGAITSAGVLAALYLPFVTMPGGIGGMAQTVRTFMGIWSFNGSVHPIAAAVTGELATRRLSTLAVAVTLLVATMRLDLWRTCMVFFLAAMLLSSTVHPWYLLWALAFVPICFSPAVWLFGLTITLSYAALLNVETYDLPLGLLLFEYVPVYLALVAAGLSKRYNLSHVSTRSRAGS